MASGVPGGFLQAQGRVQSVCRHAEFGNNSLARMDTPCFMVHAQTGVLMRALMGELTGVLKGVLKGVLMSELTGVLKGELKGVLKDVLMGALMGALGLAPDVPTEPAARGHRVERAA